MRKMWNKLVRKKRQTPPIEYKPLTAPRPCSLCSNRVHTEPTLTAGVMVLCDTCMTEMAKIWVYA